MKFCIPILLISLSLPAKAQLIEEYELRIDPNPEKIYLGDENKTVKFDQDKIDSSYLDVDKFWLFLEVRRNLKNGLPLYTEPKEGSEIVIRLMPGDVLNTRVTGQEFEEREKAEQNDKGIWRSVEWHKKNGEVKKLYFYDYWKNFHPLYNSSRGVSLELTKSSKDLEVYSELPKSTIVNCKDRQDVFCFNWKPEQGYMYATESRVVELNSITGPPKQQLMYFTRFVRPEDGEKRWARGWLKSDTVQRRIDEPSCVRKRCVTRDLVKNNPEEIRGLFIELGVIKRPKLKKKEADKTFFVSSANLAKDGEVPFNRWMQRMQAEMAKDKRANPKKPVDEVAYLFEIRPVKEWSYGLGYFTFKQEGDFGDFEFSEFGPSLNANFVFPVFLDFELQVMAEIMLPLVNDNTGADYLLPMEVTNDLLWGVAWSSTVSLYVGPGVVFRSMWGSEAGAGLTSLFGAHLSFGFFSPDHYGFAYYGFTGRDFNDGTGFPEWSVLYGIRWNRDSKDKGKVGGIKDGAFLKVTGYEYERTEVDLITDVETDGQYEAFRASLNYLQEF